MNEDNTDPGAEEAPRSLLLVEDERLVRTFAAQGLRQAGYRVETAESAEEALAWFGSGGHADLALLDLYLPGRDGLWLAQQLRALGRVPFLIVSACGDAELVEQAAALGAWGYLVKPLHLAQLLPAIETALARAQDDSALRDSHQQLQGVVCAERDISVAVGITMALHQMRRTDAFELLRRNARTQRRKLLEVAQQVLAANLVR
ncbi:MAG: ANTAR domain-containing response regulator [Rhodoferax sp.]